jgi:hypothetical protein
MDLDTIEKPSHEQESTTLKDTESENATSPAQEISVPQDDDYRYITGIKLILVLSGITLVYFLQMLDSSIVSTVGSHLREAHICLLIRTSWPGYSSNYQ